MIDKTPADSANEEHLLEDILRQATPRPQPSTAARERALRELRGEWRSLTAERRKRRQFLALGAAASIALATLFGLQWFNADTAPALNPQAQILRIDGDAVTVNGQLVAADDFNAMPLSAGDQLQTTRDSHAAIGWGNGSLRLDAASTITMLENGAINLVSGAVYFDSQQYGHDSASRIIVRTVFGEISHLGTQFQARINDAELTLQVREGAVDIKGPRVEVQIAAGESLHVTGNGEIQRRAISSHDPSWQWATEIAPELSLDGRSTADVLNWIGRETGQRVQYRSNQARQLASSEARGIGTLAPIPALRTIPYMTSLDYSIVDGLITVELATPVPVNP